MSRKEKSDSVSENDSTPVKPTLAQRSQSFGETLSTLVAEVKELNDLFRKLGESKSQQFNYSTTINGKSAEIPYDKNSLEAKADYLVKRMNLLKDLAFPSKAKGSSGPRKPAKVPYGKLDSSFSDFLEDEDVDLGTLTYNGTSYSPKELFSSLNSGYSTSAVVRCILQLYQQHQELYLRATQNIGNAKPNKSFIGADAAILKHFKGAFDKISSDKESKHTKLDTANMSLIGGYFTLGPKFIDTNNRLESPNLAKYIELLEQIPKATHTEDTFIKIAKEVDSNDKQLIIRANIDKDMYIISVINKEKKGKASKETVNEEEDDNPPPPLSKKV